MIGRRGFIAGILGACAAPAIVRSGVLMPVRTIWTPPWPQTIDVNADNFRIAILKEEILQHLPWSAS